MVMKQVGSKVKAKPVAKMLPKPRIHVKPPVPVSRSVYDPLKESTAAHMRVTREEL